MPRRRYVVTETRRFDAVVVGGRVAGSLTALELARRGMTVAVLEAVRFPSDTMSTHFFRGDGLVRSLARFEVLDEVLATDAPPLRSELFFDNGSTPVEEPPQEPGEVGFSLSVRRVTLDAILARRAGREPGVELRTGVRVRDLICEGERVVGVVADDGRACYADLVVGADGRRSGVARRVHARRDQEHPPARVMSFRYVTEWRDPDGLDPCCPEFSLLGDELAYVFPSDGGVACIAVSMPVTQWRPTSAARSIHFDERVNAHPGIARRYRAARPLGPVVSAPAAPSRVIEAAGPGWALVGDAGTQQDPWTGFGMDTAARQAAALAEACADGEDWAKRYNVLRDAVTLERFAETLTGARDLRALSAT